MSEKEKAEHQLQVARTRGRMTQLFWRILPYVLFVALAAVVVYALSSDSEQQERISTLEQEVESSDTAAQAVAQEKQDQGRRISDLCASGEVDTSTERGKRVCEEAEAAAEEDPAEQVAAVGATGPRGPQGLPGRAGNAGQDGADGADGTAGAPGETGPAGAEGAAGAPGTDGAAGADGDDGEQGAPGPTGTPGEAGEAGEAGASGSDGKPGATGAQGATGAKGDPGPAGPQGATGERGPRGETGPAGADGQDGRGITSATCDPDTGRWTITYSDDTSEDAGPCIATAPDEPAPTPTPTTEEVTP
ncbi:collagen-like protein [Brachybacterium paraconglomeratum]|uniref:collagen-like protein n=1 Tax=Brachybacterium paraconglomeratum TaxID=173362 RepID=UPI00026C69C9|nr:collagen-like protein [Brachybacterium paraconglomeratum]